MNFSRRAFVTGSLVLARSAAPAENPFAPYLGFYMPVQSVEGGAPDLGSILLLSASTGAVKGRVVPRRGVVLPFVSAKILNGDLDFRTSTLKPVAYEFHGHFLQAPPFPKDDKTVVLEGTLTTYTYGKSKTEATVRFVTSGGGE